MTTRDLDSFSSDAPKPQSDEYRCVECRTALSRSKLPGLDFALNPYVGCAHDCVYCYAPFILGMERAKWGADIAAKSNIPRLLAEEAQKVKGTVGVGTVTDPYQPMEKETGLTRKCLEVLAAKRIRFSILTKSDLVLRDLDLIKRCPGSEVGVTVTTIDDWAASTFEPHAPSPRRRLEAVRQLVSSGVEAYVLIGPVIPTVVEKDTELFLQAIVDTGVKRVMTDRLRLRPGMLELFGQLPAMKGDAWARFHTLARSPGYLREIVSKVESVARKKGLVVESAF